MFALTVRGVAALVTIVAATMPAVVPTREVVARHSGKCLDVNGGASATGDGVKIVQWTCNGGTNQQWRVNTDGTIVGVESGLCLDVIGQGTANGVLIDIWTCNGGANQRWSR